MITLPSPTQTASTTTTPIDPIPTPHLSPTTPFSQVPNLASRRILNPSWLWHGHIPCGSITLLDGPCGSGKTQFLLDLAARVSSDQPMPDGSDGLYGSVIFISPYDPYLLHAHPVLTLAHADTSRIFPFSVAPDAPPTTWTSSSTGSASSDPHDTYHSFSFDDNDLFALDSLIRHTHCRLLIIDSWSATFDETFSFSQRTIARLLATLRTLVAAHNLACILVRSSDPRSRTNRLPAADTSPHLLASAPTSFSILPDPLAPQHSLLVPGKHTFSIAAPLLQFHLSSHPTYPAFPQLHWDGPSDLALDDLPFQPTVPTLAPTRQHILRILQQQSALAPISIPALLELLPHLNYELLRKTLQRMLHDHQLVTPQRGLYALPSSVPDMVSPPPVPEDVSPPPVPDTVSVSPDLTQPTSPDIPSSSSSVPEHLSPAPVPNTMSPPDILSRPSQPITHINIL